jgi:flagellar hook protein FlgE
MAINGDGYFVVAQPTGQTDNQPVFNSVNYFTRRGDFQMNQSGYLVNGAGYYLMGIPVNPTTGNPQGSVPQVLQFDNNFVPAQATTQIRYQANLPSTPPSLLNQSDFEANPLAGAPIAAEIQGTGATLQPDAPAIGTGTTTMLATTTLSSLGISSGDQITVSDGTNTTTYTSTSTDTVQDLMDYIDSGASGTAHVAASLNSNGNLVLKTIGANADTETITVGGNCAAAIGFGAGQNSFSRSTS